MKFKLLTDESANSKLAKSGAKSAEWYSVGLSLAPHSLSGHNVCPSAGECRNYCIGEHSGNAVVFRSTVMAARIRKTQLFFADRAEFLRQLYHDLERAQEGAEKIGKRLACRLNTFSDLAWEQLAPGLFSHFRDVQFYDYTKIRGRMEKYVAGNMPNNYHLTYSISERTPKYFAGRILDHGGTCAAAIDVHIRSSAYLPSIFELDGKPYPTIDGDNDDLRFLDERGSVVLLRAKGNLLSESNQFVQPIQ